MPLATALATAEIELHPLHILGAFGGEGEGEREVRGEIGEVGCLQ